MKRLQRDGDGNGNAPVQRNRTLMFQREWQTGVERNNVKIRRSVAE